MAEWFAYGQADSGTYRGGWQYSANSNTADGSTNQWPLLAIAAAEDNNAIKTPVFVRTEAPYFMNYSRHATKDNRNGGWGYQGPNDVYVNHAKTAAGMLYNYFEGNSTSHPDVQAALGYLYRYWSSNNYDGGGAWNVGLGNSYAMYGIMKAMRKPQPNILRVVEYNYNTSQQTANSFDWYYTPPGQTQEGLATNLVRRQAAAGNWSDTIGNNAQSGAFATGWDILILSKGVTTIPPQAQICDCTLTWDNNQNIVLDGSCSTHPDLNRSIVSWEWDFDYQNNTFTTDYSGQTGVKVGGYQTYGAHPVALKVTDDNPIALGGPQTSLATCSITTKPPNNCPHPDAGPAYLAFHDVAFQLDASGSSDPDGDDLSYAWDLDNDGQFDDAVGVSPTVTFSQIGTFTIAVQVTDVRNDGGATQPCSRVDYSTVEIGNHAPVSNPGGPYVVTPGQTIVLSGGGSSDPDGDIITFGWDLNNDGTFTDSTNVAPTFTAPANAAAGTVYSVCLKVADPFQRTDTKCTTVTVQKLNTPPTCSLPQPAIVAECTGAGVTVTLDGSTSADADGDPLSFQWSSTCGNAAIVNPNQAMTTLTLLSGGACQTGCAATLVVSDGKAQTTCSRNIEIVDHTDPSFTMAPQSTTIQCDANTLAAVNAWLGGAASADTCTTSDVANDYVGVAGGCGGATGSAHVTWTSTDACGNDVQTAADLSIVDTAAPTVACPAPVTLECAGRQTEVNLTATADDACFGARPVNGPFTGLYPVGTSTVTFSSGDACGNTGACDTTVTITDSTAPSIACPAAETIECDAQGAATNVAVGAATATDACGDATVTTPAAASYPLGTSTVTQTATDAYGNQASCDSTITVVDTTRPALACPADLTLECNTLGGAAAVDTGHATATDVCSGVTVTDPAIGTWPLGTNAATHTAIDAAGNGTSCNNLVTVVDTTDPTIACPANETIECNAHHAATGVDVAAATSTDVCGATTVDAPAADQTFPLGTSTVTQSATDGNGNDATCSSTVTIVDTTDPTIACPADVVVECTAHGQALAVDAGHATATDVCNDTTVTDPAVASYALGTTTVTHSAIDEAGNATSCTNHVIVRDTTGPVFDPASLGPRTVLGSCGAGNVSFTLPTATDACETATVTCTPVAGTSVGANTVTCTATDVAGNVTTTTITVNVLAPLRLAFHSPLEDDNQANDVDTDADVANLFKVGSTIPHQLKIFACNGTDVTASVASQVTLRLTETYRSGVGGASSTIVPEYSGVGDAGGLLVYNGAFFKYNLNTNKSDYPAGTASSAAYFSSLVTATYNVAPWIVVAREDARLESR